MKYYPDYDFKIERVDLEGDGRLAAAASVLEATWETHIILSKGFPWLIKRNARTQQNDALFVGVWINFETNEFHKYVRREYHLAHNGPKM